MDMYRYVRMCKDVHDCLCACIDVNGVYGYVWMCMLAYACLCVYACV